MQKHTKIYLEFFDIQYDVETGFCDPVECTIQGSRCKQMSVDIHHIDARGMGGNPNQDKDVIENLISGCRPCHDDAEAGLISKQTLYDRQYSKILMHLTEKINRIMKTILEKIKELFKVNGTVHHGKYAEYFKVNLLGQIFVFWNCRTGEISKLEGRDLFDKDVGFSGKTLLSYYSPIEKKIICEPEELKQLYDDLMIYQDIIKKQLNHGCNDYDFCKHQTKQSEKAINCRKLIEEL